MNKDKKKVIDQILEMIQWNVRRNFNRLIKLKLQKILVDKKLLEADVARVAQFEEEKERDIFENVILANLEAQLEGSKAYLTGFDYTIADLAYFNQLTNVLSVLEE